MPDFPVYSLPADPDDALGADMLTFHPAPLVEVTRQPEPPAVDTRADEAGNYLNPESV
ncbi:MAG: hypothetical protein H0W42_11950, partial [Gemmatimonadaceae bacterium]|nr:hypothetical protein [Gemmatimonadaceae bacterium]